jgi:hypothetical protein
VRGDDAEDDRRDTPRPRRVKSRRGKGSAMPWIIAGVGVAVVLFLLCAGTIAVVAFVGMKGDHAGPKAPVAVNNAGDQVQLKQGTGRRVQLVNGRFEIKSDLSVQDPFDPDGQGHRCKLFQIDLQMGRSYVIDMTSPNNDVLDPYLRIEDLNKNVLAEDDDSGGNLNARITYVARHTGPHIIVATSFHPEHLGPFTLTIREVGGK